MVFKITVHHLQRQAVIFKVVLFFNMFYSQVSIITSMYYIHKKYSEEIIQALMG